MATSEAKEIKKQETLVRFSIISYKTRLRVICIRNPIERVALLLRSADKKRTDGLWK